MYVASPNERQLSGLPGGRTDVDWKLRLIDAEPVSPATAGMLTSTPLTRALTELSVTACENQPGCVAITTAPAGTSRARRACSNWPSSAPGVMDSDCWTAPPTETVTVIGDPSGSMPETETLP